MILIPWPKSFCLKEGIHRMHPHTEIALLCGCTDSDYKSAKQLQKAIQQQIYCDFPIVKVQKKIPGRFIYLCREDSFPHEHYRLNADEMTIMIEAGSDAGMFYGVQTLIQIIKTTGCDIPGLTIEDAPQFAVRGYLQDITRGKIPTLDSLKKLADRLSHYKCNQLQLYIEHSFAFRKQTEVWFEADPITADEILELDLYCRELHIELVPCMATFGHLYTPLETESFQEFRELETLGYEVPFSFIDRIYHHTLNISNEGSLQYICDALDEVLPLFSSRKFNICGDETHDLCKGRSRHLLEDKKISRRYTEFIDKIITHINKHGSQAMMWGDIISKYPQELKYISDNTIFLNWMYEEEPDVSRTKLFAASGKTQYVCSATQGWNRLVNETNSAFLNIRNLYRQGKAFGAQGAINTDWGDYGHINMTGNSLPALIFGAATAWNTDSDESFEECGRQISILEYGDRTGEFVNLMCGIGSGIAVHWSDLMNWYEWYFINRLIVEGKDPVAMDAFAAKDLRAVSKSYEFLEEAMQKLLGLAGRLNAAHTDEFKQAVLGTEGSLLMQSFYLNIRRYGYGQEKVETIHPPGALAVLLERWFCDYAKLWRELNRESELFRLREVIKKFCLFLRRAA